MRKRDLLKKYYDTACNNLLCYSENYGMSKPKEGYEKEWGQAKEEVKLLEVMYKEYVGAHSGPFGKTTFIGKVFAYHTDMVTATKERYVKHIEIQDTDGNIKLLEIELEVGKALYNTDRERHERYDKGLSTEITFKIEGTQIYSWEWKEV